jgi:hypothetical protein
VQLLILGLEQMDRYGLHIRHPLVDCKQHLEIDLLTGIKITFCLVQHFRMPKGCSQLRHCATSRKVVGLIPDGVIWIFHWHNPSSHTRALGLNQSLTEMSTRNISCGMKSAGAYGRQPYQLHVPTVLISGSLNLLEPSGSCHWLRWSRG